MSEKSNTLKYTNYRLNRLGNMNTPYSMESYFIQLAKHIDRVRLKSRRQKNVIEELKSIDLWRAVICECLATTLYVLLGCASLLAWPKSSPSTETDNLVQTIWTSLCFGLVTATLVQCFNHISGAHFNPAVTFAETVTMRISPVKGFLYLLAQCGGGIAGAALLYGIAPEEYRKNLGVAFIRNGTVEQGFGMELILSFIVVLTIVVTNNPNHRGLGGASGPIGGVVTLAHLIGMKWTGAGLNPARCFGPAFIQNYWADHWIYWAGPMAGGLIAGILHKYIFDPYRRAKTVGEALDEMERGSKRMSSAYTYSTSCNYAPQSIMSTTYRSYQKDEDGSCDNYMYDINIKQNHDQQQKYNLTQKYDEKTGTFDVEIPELHNRDDDFEDVFSSQVDVCDTESNAGYISYNTDTMGSQLSNV